MEISLRTFIHSVMLCYHDAFNSATLLVFEVLVGTMKTLAENDNASEALISV